MESLVEQWFWFMIIEALIVAHCELFIRWNHLDGATQWGFGQVRLGS